MAHCVVNGSPYMATGYILHLEGSWDEGPLMKGVRPELLAPWEFSLVTVVIWGVISEAAGYQSGMNIL